VAGEQESHSWDSHAEVWQRILNEVEVPARSAQKDSPQPIPVVARICWERDGDETVDTVVHVWTSRAVLVELTDPRRRTHGVWVSADDVRRRAGRQR
jgi:hypothetical protein